MNKTLFMNNNYYAVIMAGGVGARFWPLSKKSFPKQFQDLLGSGQTLIQKTYDRLAQIIPQENILVLTNALYKDLTKKQLPQVTDNQIVLEPAKRDTAPCILLSALKIYSKNPDATMIVAPSDHWIEDEEAFAENVDLAFKTAQEQDLLMTLGIHPTFPNTGYGYIAYSSTDDKIKPVKKFTEKPDYETAKSFLKAGNYLWNAGIFLGRAEAFVSAYKTYLPKMYALFSPGQELLNTDKEEAFILNHYEKAEQISFDYAIMEKAEHVAVLPATFNWNDLGSWGALYDQLDKDLEGNVVLNAEAYFENAHENMVRTPEGKTVVIKGLSNYIVVENEDILLIYPKADEQKIKQTRAKVKKKLGRDLA